MLLWFSASVYIHDINVHIGIVTLCQDDTSEVSLCFQFIILWFTSESDMGVYKLDFFQIKFKNLCTLEDNVKLLKRQPDHRSRLDMNQGKAP